jgi:tRNA A37 threonylcarbamoyladenosine synthetase subunit TsaC/SUA5/YrdC
VTSTSANLPGAPPALSAHEAAAAAALTGTGPWLVLDGGTLPASQPSTIVRCVGGVTGMIRAGAVPLARLREVVEEIDGGT